MKKDKQFVLVLNSHSLDEFQKCGELYRLREKEELVPLQKKEAFVRGSAISKVLELWYTAKQRNYSYEKMKKIEFFLFKRMAMYEEIPEDDRLHIATRIKGYFNKYRNENYDIIGVEDGFSKVLYETPQVKFVYEGAPDVFLGAKGLTLWMDHKSESRKSDIFVMNNQALGYCWGTGTTYGVYNYIGLQQDAKDNEVLRRVSLSYTDAQIEQWKNDTIHWYFQIMWAVVNNKYFRSWNCTGKYGICDYSKICTEATKKAKDRIIELHYRKEEPHKSW